MPVWITFSTTFVTSFSTIFSTISTFGSSSAAFGSGLGSGLGSRFIGGGGGGAGSGSAFLLLAAAAAAAAASAAAAAATALRRSSDIFCSFFSYSALTPSRRPCAPSAFANVSSSRSTFFNASAARLSASLFSWFRPGISLFVTPSSVASNPASCPFISSACFSAANLAFFSVSNFLTIAFILASPAVSFTGGGGSSLGFSTIFAETIVALFSCSLTLLSSLATSAAFFSFSIISSSCFLLISTFSSSHLLALLSNSDSTTFSLSWTLLRCSSASFTCCCASSSCLASASFSCSREGSGFLLRNSSRRCCVVFSRWATLFCIS
mmetsp:Transcript_150171/g.280064  ORF Transcript_150171/g.280064 Transcript_150171/m.280064 type:complete len:323 (+) Transcript_150171:1822-2790(+)